jgi:hypothetical protein
MSADFSFDVDPARDLIRITLTGFFQRDDVAALGAAHVQALARLYCPANAHVTLVDVRELKIQSQETMDAFETLLSAREQRSRRLALVVAPTLARMQVERALAARPAVQCFSSPYDAVAWLLDESEAAPLLRAAG